MLWIFGFFGSPTGLDGFKYKDTKLSEWEKEWIWEELRQGIGYDQNKVCENLKELILFFFVQIRRSYRTV